MPKSEPVERGTLFGFGIFFGGSRKEEKNMVFGLASDQFGIFFLDHESRITRRMLSGRNP
jgi:hypothetical protein